MTEKDKWLLYTPLLAGTDPVLEAIYLASFKGDNFIVLTELDESVAWAVNMLLYTLLDCTFYVERRIRPFMYYWAVEQIV